MDSGVAMNIMPVDVMKELWLKIDILYGKCYAMDNRTVHVVGIIKHVDFKFPDCPDVSCKTNITMVEALAHYGMLLSSQWSNLVWGHIYLDLSYANIPINGRYVRIDTEPRFTYLVENFNADYGVNFCQIEIHNFKVNLSKLV